MRILIEVIGWAGALLILTSYALLSSGRLEGRSRPYQLLNFTGSACFVLNSGYNGAWPSAALNLIWMGIGSVMLWQLARARPAK
jgi:hypothetical protein